MSPPRPISGTGLATLRGLSVPLSLLPPGSGRHLAAREIYMRALRGRPTRRVRRRLRGGALFELALDDRIQAQAFLLREYEPALVRFICSRLPAAGVFLDVGAHVGMVSLSVASRCRSRDVEVHSFEPHPLNASALRRNAELNPGLRVSVNAVAVGEHEGTATLDPSPLSGESGWHGLAAGDRAAASGEGEARPKVPVVSLDGYIAERGIERVDVLKVDVEGWEPAVLAGAQQALARGAIRCVVAEANRERLVGYGFEPDAIERELERHGLRPVAIPGAGLQRLRRRRPGIDYAFALSD